MSLFSDQFISIFLSPCKYHLSPLSFVLLAALMFGFYGCEYIMMLIIPHFDSL